MRVDVKGSQGTGLKMGGETDLIEVVTPYGIVRIREDHGYGAGHLKVNVIAFAEMNNDQNVEVSLAVGARDQDRVLKPYKWRSDVLLYHSGSGRIIAKNQTVEPYKEFAVVKRGRNL